MGVYEVKCAMGGPSRRTNGVIHTDTRTNQDWKVGWWSGHVAKEVVVQALKAAISLISWFALMHFELVMLEAQFTCAEIYRSALRSAEMPLRRYFYWQYRKNQCLAVHMNMR